MVICLAVTHGRLYKKFTKKFVMKSTP